jgi:hypothetical protein
LPPGVASVGSITSLLLRLDLIGAADSKSAPSAAADEFLSGQATRSRLFRSHCTVEEKMNSIIYIVGLVVVIGAVLAFLGLR